MCNKELNTCKRLENNLESNNTFLQSDIKNQKSLMEKVRKEKNEKAAMVEILEKDLKRYKSVLDKKDKQIVKLEKTVKRSMLKDPTYNLSDRNHSDRDLHDLEAMKKLVRNLDKEKNDLKKKKEDTEKQLLELKDKVKHESLKRQEDIEFRIEDIKRKKDLEVIDL